MDDVCIPSRVFLFAASSCGSHDHTTRVSPDVDVWSVLVKKTAKSGVVATEQVVDIGRTITINPLNHAVCRHHHHQQQHSSSM